MGGTHHNSPPAQHITGADKVEQFPFENVLSKISPRDAIDPMYPCVGGTQHNSPPAQHITGADEVEQFPFDKESGKIQVKHLPFSFLHLQNNDKDIT